MIKMKSLTLYQKSRTFKVENMLNAMPCLKTDLKRSKLCQTPYLFLKTGPTYSQLELRDKVITFKKLLICTLSKRCHKK